MNLRAKVLRKKVTTKNKQKNKSKKKKKYTHKKQQSKYKKRNKVLKKAKRKWMKFSKWKEEKEEQKEASRFEGILVEAESVAVAQRRLQETVVQFARNDPLLLRGRKCSRIENPTKTFQRNYKTISLLFQRKFKIS